MERKLQIEMDQDLLDFESNVFQSRRFSVIQRYFASIRSKPSFLLTLRRNEVSITGEKEKSNAFNSFFLSISLNNEQPVQVPSWNELNFLKTAERDVALRLHNLRKQAIGPYGISNTMLKSCCGVLAKSLKLLFQRMINKGLYPYLWNVAIVTPVYKDSDRMDIKDYRPIRLLCNISEVSEKVISEPLYSFLVGKLDPNQFGFREAKSAACNWLLFWTSYVRS